MKKKTYNEIKKNQLLESLLVVFKDVNVEIISEYINNKTPVLFKCRCDNKIRKRIDNIFNNPHQTFCKYCGLMNGDIKDPRHRKGTKFSFNYTNKLFEGKGLNLLTKRITGPSQLVDVKCKCGKIFKAQISNILSNGKYTQHQCKECKNKQREKTFKDLYGGIGFASAELNDKSTIKGYKFKNYTWKDGSITTHLQGYEPFALEYLESIGYVSEDIINKKCEVPRIKYIHEGKIKYYFPDFYVPNENKVIEVKSLWTEKLHKDKCELKKLATIKDGFKYLYIMFNGDLRREEWKDCINVVTI